MDCFTASAECACAATGTGYIFKASYDKANRTSVSGKRGLGLQEGLQILRSVREEIGCPVLTDVHLPQDCATVAEAVDMPVGTVKSHIRRGTIKLKELLAAWREPQPESV